MQALLVENAVELQQLNATIADLRQQVLASSHETKVIDTSARARQAKVVTLAAIQQAVAPRIQGLKERITALQQYLSCLLGDSMHAAAMCVYAGMLPDELKRTCQAELQRAIDEASLPHSPDLTLRHWMEFLEQQHTLLPRRVIMDEGTQHAMYCLSMVRNNQIRVSASQSQPAYITSTRVTYLSICFITFSGRAQTVSGERIGIFDRS